MLDAATAVFASRGYRQTDVQFIADALGMGKGSIYRQFGTKEALFFAAVDRVICRLNEFINAEASAVDDSLEKIRVGMRAHLRFFDAHPAAVELLVLERAEFKDRDQPSYAEFVEANAEPWRVLLRGLIEDGRIRDVPVDRIVDVLSDVLFGAVFTNHFAGRRRSFESQAEEVTDIVFHGLLPRSSVEGGSTASDHTSSRSEGGSRS